MSNRVKRVRVTIRLDYSDILIIKQTMEREGLREGPYDFKFCSFPAELSIDNRPSLATPLFSDDDVVME